MSIVPADAVYLLWSVLVALVAFGFWSEKHSNIGRHLTGIVIAMVSAMILSNLRLIPFTSDVYYTVFERVLPVAIPLMLFRADLVEAFRKGGKTVVAFCIGAIGVVIGAFVASLLIRLGDISAVTAGLFTATYTGGSANFAAVAISADFNDSATLVSMVAADIIATNLQTIFLIALPGIAIARFVMRGDDGDIDASHDAGPEPAASADREFDLAGLSVSLAVALLLVYLGATTAEYLDRPSLAIVCTTVYALLVSNFCKPLVRIMSHDFELGLFAIFLFLVALAAGADVGHMLDSGLTFFVYALILLLVHTVVIAIGARVFGLGLRNMVIGSTACVGGVTSAAAIASAKGWRDLIVPGILAGTIGNAFGTLLGVWVWTVLS